MGPGILRVAIVDLVDGSDPQPVCMINVTGPIGGPPVAPILATGGAIVGYTPAPPPSYSQSWTHSDVPGVRFGASGATLGVYVYEADSPAVISATAIF
jgi:hypothetical protein